MTNEESNQGQGTPDPNAAAGQPSFPPPQDTPPSYPYPPAQQPLQQPITGGSSPQNFPAPPPYMPAQQQPYQQPITGGAPQGYPPTPPPYPYAQQQPYPQYAGGGEATQAYAPAPTPYPYTPPVAPKKSNRGLKILLIVLAVVVVLGA